MSWTPLHPEDPKNTLMVGDEAWDLMSEVVHEIADIYQRELGRLPYSEELLRTFQDVLLPSWSSVVNEGQTTVTV